MKRREFLKYLGILPTTYYFDVGANLWKPPHQLLTFSNSWGLCIDIPSSMMPSVGPSAMMTIPMVHQFFKDRGYEAKDIPFYMKNGPHPSRDMGLTNKPKDWFTQ